MNRLILGTAGHIDHGKSALVRALTGTDPDRLPEEKQRGITIDLGFAHFQIGNVSYAVVDVPGHENFIRNMLAGASGLDAVLLVVAADEGVMPQTREHLAILDLLDVRTGIVALTKADLAGPEWLELVRDDVRDLLATTTLAGAPIIPVSSRTGQGLDHLREAISKFAPQATRAANDIFRMPVDRVFSVHGTGTVVTGSIWNGRTEADAHVNILPHGGRARIRAIQVHGQDVPAAGAGERAALALAGVHRGDMQRGAVLTSVSWPATHMLTVAARLIAGTPWALQPRQRVHVHLGTADVLARAVLLDRAALQAGDQGWVQLRLESPLVARAGDRVVLRSYSPVSTIGGGIVAEFSDHKRSRVGPADTTRLDAILNGTAAGAVTAAIELAGRAGAPVAELPLRTPISPEVVRQTLADHPDDVVIIADRAYSAQVIAETRAAILDAAAELHRRYPLRPALDTAELRSAVFASADLLRFCLDAAAGAGDVLISGGRARLPGFEPRLNARQAAQKVELLQTLAAAGLAPPDVAELAGQGNEAETRALLELLAAEQRLQQIAPDFFVETGALNQATARTTRELAGQTGLAANAFRSTLPVTRKHLIPLLEYFDRVGVTVREGDLRRVPGSAAG